MPGKVFISCGQRGAERRTAQAVAAVLRDEFGLTSYLAFEVQSLADIMTIIKELRSADYYIFIDFLRRAKKPGDLPVSLFTHQELAVAYLLDFDQIIAFQQSGTRLEVFLRYMLAKPASFRNSK